MNGLLLLSVLAAVHSFRLGSTWVVIDENGDVVARHAAVGTSTPIFDGDVSPDGQTFVFSLENGAAPGRLVLWRIGASSVENLVDEVGFFGAPRFSDDGKWIFVAHYPKAGGPPGEHGPNQYAQLYRINLKERDFEQITSSVGCHMSSWSPDGTTVVFGHSTCRGQKFIEQLVVRPGMAATEERLSGGTGLSDEPHSDGMLLVFVRRNGNQFELVSKDKAGRETTLFTGPLLGPVRPRMLKQTVLFQHGNKVMQVNLKTRKVAVVAEAQ